MVRVVRLSKSARESVRVYPFIFNAGQGRLFAVRAENADQFGWASLSRSGKNDGVSGSGYPSAVTLPDGNLLVAGWEFNDTGDAEFLAVKVDPSDGSLIWTWKDGSTSDDLIRSAAAGRDGSIFLAGYTRGNWSEPIIGDTDYAGVKLDSSGSEIWRLQGGLSDYDEFQDVAVGQDGYAVFGGRSSEGFYMRKVDGNGDTIWEWSDGTGGNDVTYAVTMPGNNNSVVLAGTTSGDWSGLNAGSYDLAAVMVDSDGNEVWRWQEGNAGSDRIYGALGTEDGSIFLVGWIFNSTEEDLGGGTPLGLEDIVAFKFHINGTELWKWQGGTVSSDRAISVALRDDGSLIIGAITEGSWSGDNQGDGDFMLATLNASTGSLLSSRWQAGTSYGDFFGQIAMGPSLEWVAIVGSTFGSFARSNPELYFEGVIAMLTTNASTIVPSPAPTPPSVHLLTLMPTLAPMPMLAPSSPSTEVAPASPSSPLTSPAPTTLAGSMPPSSTPSLSESSSLSLMIVISVIVSVASVGVLFGLVSWGGRILVRLRRRYSGNGDLVEGNGWPGSASGSVRLKRGSANGGVLGKGDSRAFSRAQKGPDVVLNSNDVQPKYTRHSATSFSQDVPATVMHQSRRITALADLPAYDDVMQLGTKSSGHGGGLSAARLQEAPATVLDHSQSADEVDTFADFDATNKSKSESSSNPGVGLGQAILETTRELAQASMVPAVSEAAAMISVLVRLVTDNKQSDSGADGKLRWCRTIVTLLGRAAYILGEGEGLPDEVERGLLQDIRESIDDLVQLIQMYKSKNKLVRVITSSLFKRRQEELESAINRALSHLQMGLQLHGGHKLNAVRQDVKDAFLVQQQHHHQQQQSPQVFVSDDAGLSRADSQRQRRQRQLEQLEISEEQLTLTDELLGKGGFGSVYMADYNGRNAAAKILPIEHDLAGSEESASGRGLSRGDSSTRSLGLQKDQRQAFIRELDAMRRLRSPYTVNVYGAVTSRRDRLILVMELMSGGDLRKFLKSASGPIEEERARRIVGEVCAGMAFLHDMQTIHGDLKSANVLFDGYGRAKICDFGTSRWAQHVGSTDLATYTSGMNKGTPMSLPWTAPEVLNKGETSFKSDVYSFGMVTWEVLTRNIPWANECAVLQIYQRVVFKEERPDIPDEAPFDLVEIVRACWMTEPSRRPSFQWLLRDMKSNGWKEV